ATASGTASWAGLPAGAGAPLRGRVRCGSLVARPVYRRLTEDVAAGLLSPRPIAEGLGAQRADPLRPVGQGGQRASGSWVLGKPCAGRRAVTPKTGAGGLSRTGSPARLPVAYGICGAPLSFLGKSALARPSC